MTEESAQIAAKGDTSTRDHLANERTFLAWLRTAANVMIVGLAIMKFGTGGDVTVESLAAGGILVVLGGVGVGYGLYRYNVTRHRIESSRLLTHEQAWGPALAAVFLIVGVAASTVILLIADTR